MSSDPVLDIRELDEYDDHRKVVFLTNNESELEGFIAVHRKNESSPSFGATRLWHYASSLDGLRDALRLSRIMSYKAALAGIPYGGAKGVIVAPERLTSMNRRALLLSYTKEVNALHGDFITGTDVGISQEDLKLMRSASPFFVGSNSDVAKYVALGICFCIETCFSFLDGSDLAGKRFAIQGLGKVGAALLGLVYPEADMIYASDADNSVAEEIRNRFPKVLVVEPSEIHKQRVDVFAPCALSGVLNSRNIVELQCRLIAGGANSQLQNETIGDSLYQLDILYAPDYVVNVGGLIAVHDEYEHKIIHHQRIYDRLFAIKQRLQGILERSKKEGRPAHRIANEMAEGVLSNY